MGLYGNIIAEFDKIDVEAGLRGEYIDVSYKFAPNRYFENDHYDYFDLFPNARLTFKLNRSNKISLFYNRRIDRPGEEMLRVYPQYRDPELLKIGKPSLRPQYTQNVELAHRWMWNSGSLYTALYFKNIQQPFSRIYLLDPGNSEITILAQDNVERAINTGIELSVEQSVSKWWNISASFNVYQNTIFAHSGTFSFPSPQNYTVAKRTDAPMFVKMSNRIKLPWNVQMELSGVYFSNKNIAQGKELSRGGVDLGLKKMLLNNKLEMTLTATDIFNTMGVRQDIQSEGFKVEFCNFYETQIITIGARYKF
ncbi:MAG: outer membrane beta-barrel family protein [Prevotellaceae bacterium]|nr:outer membrane beta-barrel family protein [Prevotellaceae bacterium]